MSNKPLLPSLSELKKRIEDQTPADDDASSARASRTSSAALRIGADIVAGTSVGVLIGYQLDKALAFSPLFLLCFTALGLIAGIRMAMKTAETVSNTSEDE